MLLRPILCLKSSIKNVVNVTRPRRPTWISIKITTCPNIDQWVKVSYTTSPVTQVPEVAVKIELISGVKVPDFDEIGRQSKKVPIIITAKKLKQIILAGVKTVLRLPLPALNGLIL